MKIAEHIHVGKDIGIASDGWALLDMKNSSIIGAGVRCFDAPETGKKRKLKNQIRQEKRSLRRVIRRKAKRMSKVRHLCIEHGLAQTNSKNLFQTLLKRLNDASEQAVTDLQGITPWSLRSDALKRPLSGAELAVILGHIAKHAGFQSNRKGGEKNVADDDKKALKAMEELAVKIGQYKTFGEALQCDPKLSKRKRNRHEVYDRMPKRDWLRKEVKIIFEEQRKLKNERATKELEDTYSAIAFSRKPLQDSEHLVRFCPFEEGEKRASKYAPSFELFRFLQKLVHLRIDDPKRESDSLSSEEISMLKSMFGKTQSFNFKKVRSKLKLGGEGRFRNFPLTEKEREAAEKTGIFLQGKRRARKAHMRCAPFWGNHMTNSRLSSLMRLWQKSLSAKRMSPLNED